MAKKLFSIVIPAFNADKYIKQSIDSALAQTCQDFEMVIVDDGSTDQTGSIIDSYAEKDDRIRVFHRPHEGAISSRRFGVSQAAGSWVIHLDADDLMKPEELETLSNKIKQYGDKVDCILFNFELLMDNGQEQVVRPVTGGGLIESEKLLTDKREVCLLVFSYSNFITLWRKATRREYVGIDDLSYLNYLNYYGDDTYQTVEILRYCKGFLFITDVLYQWRRHTTNATRAVHFPDNKVTYVRDEYAVNFLKEYYTKEDFDRYINRLRKYLYVSLVEVAVSRHSYSQKMQWFSQYGEQDFFRNCLAPSCGSFSFGGPGRKALELLEERKYRKLLFLCLKNKIVSMLKRQSVDSYIN